MALLTWLRTMVLGNPRKQSRREGLPRRLSRWDRATLVVEHLEDRINPAPTLLSSIEGITYDTDSSNNSNVAHIPPAPIGAAGPTQVVSVVNDSIEWYSKTGVRQNSQRLGRDINGSLVGSFFRPLAPLNGLSSPRVVYDQDAGHFVVAALEVQDTGTVNDINNTANILLAVSQDNDARDGWYYKSFTAKADITVNGNTTDHRADSLGLAVDEEAIYVTANMVPFGGGGNSDGTRVWIVTKGILYGGDPGGPFQQYDPFARAGASNSFTSVMPAQVDSSGGVSPTAIGTWLVGYNSQDPGLGSGSGNEFLALIQINNPLNNPTFNYGEVSLGNLEDARVTVPGAPQSGGSALVDTGDRRIQNAVWRNNGLWTAFTIVPTSGPDSGQATAHWAQINTAGSSLNAPSYALMQQGSVGGEDIATGTSTFYPSVAVDGTGNMVLGFAASASSIHPGAYYTGRLATDPTNTVQSSGTLAAGVDFYQRRLTGTVNRWGTSSSAVLDPDGSTFWVFNEYALTQAATADGNGDRGRWGTRFGHLGFVAAPTTTTAATLDGSGNLVIADTATNGKNDTLTLRSDSANSRFVITDPNNLLGSTIAGATGSGTHTLLIPFSSVTGTQIVVNTGGGRDTLTVDFSLGNFTKSISYDGGDPTTAPGDTLILTGGSFGAVRHTFTGVGAGTIDLNNDGIPDLTYSGIEPFLITSGTTDLVLDINQANITDAVLRDYTGPGDSGHSELAFTAHTGEDFQFTAPSNSLKVITHGGSSVSVQGFDAAFNTPTLAFEDTSGTASNFVLAGSELIPNATSLTVTGNAVFNLNGFSETINSLNGNGTVQGGSGTPTFTVGGSGGDGTFSGVIQDGGGTLAFTKSGSGTLALTGANTYSGTTTLSTAIANGGALLVNGSLTSNITVGFGATHPASLGGRGTISGTVTVNSGSSLAPGNSPAVLNTGGLNLLAGSSFNIEIGGNTPGNGVSGYDQANVTGSITLDITGAGVQLNLSPFGGYVPQPSDVYVLINNDGSEPVSGTFAGLGEGTILSSNFLGSGLTAYLTYKGGNGNDVAIVVAGPLTYTSAGGNLTLKLDTTGANANVWLLAGTTVLDSRPLASVTAVAINGSNTLNDNLTVDFSNGNPIPGGNLAYHGNGQSVVPPGDVLNVTGGSGFASLAYNATGVGAGNLVLNGTSTIFFDGLEPLTVTPAAGTTTIAINDGLAHTATLTSGPGSGNNTVTIDGGLESMTFANPTTLLRLVADAGSDTFTINSLDASFTAALTVNGSTGGADTVNLNAALNLSGALTVDSAVELSNLAANITATTVNVQSAATVVNAPSVTVSTSAANGNITFAGAVNDGNASPTNGLVLTAGTGTVSLPAVGAIRPLAGLSSTTTTTGGTTLTGNVSASAITLSGNVTLSGPVQLTHSGAASLNASGGTLNLAGFTLTDNATTASTTGNISDSITGSSSNLIKTGSGTLVLANNNTYGGSTTVAAGTLSLGVTFLPSNNGFETPAAPFASPPATNALYWYNPPGASWTFSGAGLAANGSAFNNANAPNGTQVAFLQTTGTFFQSVAFATAGTYVITFQAAFRNAQNGVNDFQVLVDGTPFGTFTPTTSASYLTYSTSPFTVTVGSHTITFQGLNTLGGDRTSFIDNVLILSAVGNTDRIPDTSSVTVAAGAVLDLGSNNETIGSLAGGGAVLLDTGTLATGANNSNTSFSGFISGSGNLVKTGSGTFTFSGVGTYAGSTTVSQGTLKLDVSQPAGAVAHYTFDNTTSDVTGSGHDGTIVGGGTSFVSGQFGQALNSTGSQSVSVPFSSAFGLNSFTVSAWVNMASGFASFSNGILGTRFGGDNTFDLKVQASGIHGDVGDGTNWINTGVDISNAQGGQLTAGSWALVTYVIDDGAKQFRLYVNGSLANTIGYVGTPLLMKSGQILMLGNSSGGEFMHGAIDDVFIYGRALTPGEIATLFNPNHNVLPTSTAVLLSAGGATLDLNGVNQTIDSLTGGAGTNVLLGGGTLTIAGNTTDSNFGGSISGAGNVVKNGTRTLTLGGNNSYGGTTTVNGGTLVAASNTALGTADGTAATGTLVASGAQLQLPGGVALGNEALTLNGTGTTPTAGVLQNTAGTNSWGGPITLASDTLLTVSAGQLTLGGSVNGARNLTLTAGTNALTFNGQVGNTTPLASLTATSAGTLTFGATVATTGNVTQTAGSGTTTFNGATIGGNLNVTTRNITLNTAPLTTVGTVTLNAADSLTVNANLNAGASTITLAANTDGDATGGFSQASGTTIQTSNATPSAIALTVNTATGTGTAALAALQTGAGGVITVRANGGAITDNNGAAVNLTSGSAALSAAIGIGSGDALETTLGTVAFNNATSGNVQLTNTAGLTVGSVGTLTTSFNAGTTLLTATGPLTFAVNTTQASLTARALETVPPTVNFDNLTVNSGVTVQTSAGDATLQAGDRILLNATATVTASGNVLLASAVGDNDGDGSLQLDGNLNAGASNRVELDAGSQQGATQASTGTILAGALRLLSTGSSGAFALSNSTTNDVSVLAASTAAAINYREANALLVGTVNGTSGINSGGTNVTLTTGGPLALGSGAGESITATAALVDLNSAGLTEASGSVVSAASLRLQGTGTFNLPNSNAVSTLAAATTGAIAFNDGSTPLTLGTISGTNGITSGGNNVSLSTTAGLTLGTGAGQSITAAGATVTLNAGGVSEGAGSIITANQLQLSGSGTFTLTNNNTVGTLAANLLGSLTFTASGALSVGTVSTAGITTGNGATNGGNVVLTASGLLSVDQPISTTSGSGGSVSIGSGVSVNAALTVGAGSIILNGGWQSRYRPGRRPEHRCPLQPQCPTGHHRPRQPRHHRPQQQ